jgi:broad specificity phosphatase PhoE
VNRVSHETRLVVIRHGETDDNVEQRVAGWRESRLTERGRFQAELVGAFVAERYRPVAVYASPLRRASETAASLARHLALPIRHHPDLRELHFGEAEGLAFTELKVRFPDTFARARDTEDDDVGWPGGETRREFYLRTKRVVDHISGAHVGETVAVVTHGGVVSRLLAEIFEGKPGRWSAYQPANCSIAEIVVANGVHTVTRWNVTDHLENPAHEGPEVRTGA